jgi:peptide/nickel transport system permease protein
MSTPGLTVAETDVPYSTSRAQTAAGVWRRLAANRLVLIGTVITVVIVTLGILAPWISPDDYAKQDLLNSLEPPLSKGHLLGTDQLGRDTLSRVLHGIRLSIFVGFVITAISLFFGGLLGLAAGYYRGKVDTAISAVIDIFWGFPLILVAVLLVGALGPGLVALMLAIGLINWAGFARVMRGEVLALREREFVEAARALGINDLRIMWRHILPHAVPATLVLGSYYIALAIIFEAGFSFIGMGVQPPNPSLGQMIGEARNYMLVDSWLMTIPGVTIAVLVIALNLLGDGLRDIFDPRLKDN